MSNEQHINNNARNRGAQGNCSREVKGISETARTHPNDSQQLAADCQPFAQMLIDTLLPTLRRSGAGCTHASTRSS